MTTSVIARECEGAAIFIGMHDARTGRARVCSDERATTANIGHRTGPRHLLAIERNLDAPVDNVWRCWSEPELLERWFCPKPWFVTDAHIELRPGGEFSSVMNGPDGQRFEHADVFLEVDPMRRLVTTDAFLPGWIPSERAFTVAETLFEDAGEGRTRYTARAMHWSQAVLEEHERMTSTKLGASQSMSSRRSPRRSEPRGTFALRRFFLEWACVQRCVFD